MGRVNDYTARRSGHEHSSSDKPCLTGNIGPPADWNDVYDWPVTRIIHHNLTGSALRNAAPDCRHTIWSYKCWRLTACSKVSFCGTCVLVTRKPAYVRKREDCNA